MPKIDRRIIIGYSNLSFLISVKYFFDIAKIKKDETKIKDFMNVEKLSTTMRSLWSTYGHFHGCDNPVVKTVAAAFYPGIE